MSRLGQAWAWVATLWFTALVATAVAAAAHVQRAPVFRCWNLVPVVVFSRELAVGDVVALDALSQRSVPEQFAPRDGVRPGDADALVGQRLVTRVREGDVARTWMVREVDALVPTEVEARGAELVAALDHVDVIGSLEPRPGERVVMTLLQDVLVGAPQRDGKLSLLLRPEEAARLGVAERLAVTLRAPLDAERVQSGEAMTWEKLMREHLPRRRGCHDLIELIRNRR